MNKSTLIIETGGTILTVFRWKKFFESGKDGKNWEKRIFFLGEIKFLGIFYEIKGMTMRRRSDPDPP